MLNMTVAKILMALPAPRRDDVHLAPVPPCNPVNYAPLNVQVH